MYKHTNQIGEKMSRIFHFAIAVVWFSQNLSSAIPLTFLPIWEMRRLSCHCFIGNCRKFGSIVSYNVFSCLHFLPNFHSKVSVRREKSDRLFRSCHVSIHHDCIALHVHCMLGYIWIQRSSFWTFHYQAP